VSYIGKMIWPGHLGVLYPYPVSVPMWEIIVAVLLLGSISYLVVLASPKRRYLLTGWLWYVGTLVPVIGIVQVGIQSMADRYTYVPLIGLFIMAAWGIDDLLEGWRRRQVVFAVCGGVLFSVLAMVTWVQAGYWQNSITLLQHTLEVTPENFLVHDDHGVSVLRTNLGTAFLDQGQYEEAVTQYSEALRLDPNLAKAHNNLGNAFLAQGKYEEAVNQYNEALRLNPDLAEAHHNLADIYLRQGKYDEAIRQYGETLRLDPNVVEAHYNLGSVLFLQGQYQQAANQYNEVLRLDPNLAEAHYNLGEAYFMVGNRDLALKEYETFKRLKASN